MLISLELSQLIKYIKFFNKDLKLSNKENKFNKQPLNIYTYISNLKGYNNLGEGILLEYIKRIIFKISINFINNNNKIFYSLLNKKERSIKNIFLINNNIIQ